MIMRRILNSHPKKIVCLTEETVETLYHLGMQDLIVGVSAFVKRPKEAQSKKRVCGFINANIGNRLQLKG